MMVGKSDLWYKQAILYSLDVESFMDSDGDGVGDFPGLTKRLDHLSSLGVTCLWLLPFHPSPNRDNGYDVTDYYGVDPRLGTLGDFVEFLREARERGIRVLMDLVVNHTSSEHPWFRAARKDKNSKYRSYYVWTEEEPEQAHDGMVFPGAEESIWTYDEEAGAYYLHRFYRHQPDLNISNPAVREEIRKIMGFWLELGVSGFRLDAAPFFIGVKDRHLTNVEVVEEPFSLLRGMREFLSWRRGDAVLLAEANVQPESVLDYFGDGNKAHMLFNFYLNQQLFLALARKKAAPLAEALRALPELPDAAQWANFLRNHDELDLGRLSDEERQEVYRAFAPEEDMRLYGRGIRRRLPPMLSGDRRRLELCYSLMFSLPGTPVLRYGQEIGMGDDLSLPERMGVRTVMQWADEENGGFSSAPREALVRPVIAEGPHSYERVNVAAQRRDPDSFLNWMKRLVNTRKECPEFGWGVWRVIETDNENVFAHRSEWEGGVVIAVHNLEDRNCSVTLDLSAYEKGHLIDLLGDRQYHPIERAAYRVDLQGYGYRWFRIDGMP